MEEFVVFLRDNWKFLVEILLLVISVIICLVKRTKINIPGSVISDLLIKIPSWINEAEQEIGVGKGQEKLKYVFSKAVDFLHEVMDLSTADIIRYYGENLICSIEDILSTPQKKGDQ